MTAPDRRSRSGHPSNWPLVGLRWVDVDLADATLTVTRTLVELPGVLAESEPKTAAGNRTITLDPATVTVLADHRRRQQRRYDEHGTMAEETGFLFAWPDGRPRKPAGSPTGSPPWSPSAGCRRSGCTICGTGPR
ncbi:hypothetical protein Ato02nite_031050 [Paractinoplanes toevensis]|uniref:Uncharacterized protein n=1 Tax=Paractinoplanes toevensis TaxID=571911 RepID=A0A919T9S4_9ACTN|nr:hypothetical protein Ato02nite_031050 [Actinoplanes toevensis]